MALGDERRASGAAMEQMRRQGGLAMIERRTGQSAADELNALVAPPRQRDSLPSLEPRGPIAVRRGRGSYDPAAAGHAGGGIASPLVEQDAAQREYHPATLVPSSDGLVWLRVRPLKKVVLTDANGATVVMEFANDLSQYPT